MGDLREDHVDRRGSRPRWHFSTLPASLVATLALSIGAALVAAGATVDRQRTEGHALWEHTLVGIPSDLEAGLPAPPPAGEEPDWRAPDPPTALALPPRLPTAGWPEVGQPRLFVHVSTQSDAGDQMVRAAARAFVGAGHSVAATRSVAFAIRQPRIRYFFAGDRTAALRAAAVFGAWLSSTGNSSPIRVEDFSQFRPLPSRGNIEVWLPSGGWRESRPRADATRLRPPWTIEVG